MGILFMLFFMMAGEVIKRFALPALAVVVVIGIIAAISGGSFLWAAGISAGVAVVVGLIATITAMNSGWH